jgi:hypothetical protein
MYVGKFENVYLGRNGYIGRILSASTNGAPAAPVDLSSVTRIDLEIGDIVVTSTDAANGPIQWCQDEFALGEIRIFLGPITSLAAFEGQVVGAMLIVYDPTNPLGLPWGSFSIWIQQG